MEKEDILLQKRFAELARRSFEQNIYTFTDFLSLPEQTCLFQMERELQYAGITAFGGHESCDRKIVRFGKIENLGYEEPFPIVCLQIAPLLEKFGQTLSHRDYLGALMNLGIERATLGDIFIKGKNGYLFCQKKMVEYITENLTQVHHTHVKVLPLQTIEEFQPEEPVTEHVTVASVRLDSVIAKVYSLSRTQSLELFRAKKVFIDGKQCENNSVTPKETQMVSVRGFGKFQYMGLDHTTKKGKQDVVVKIYR